MLSTSELNCFVTVAHSGSFARAATELGISQPALSKSISKLERGLAVRLFERSARGVTPTVFGEALLKRATASLAELRAASREIEILRGGEGGFVTVGAAPAVTADFVPDLIKSMAKSKLTSRMRVIEGLAEDLVEGVRSGTLDFAITTATGLGGSDDLLIRHLYEDDFVVCCGVEHRFSRSSKLTAQDLASALWVLAPPHGILRKEFERRFRNEGIEPPSAMVETGSVTLSKLLVMEHGFLSMLPRELLSFEERKGYVHILPSSWLEWRRQVSLITRRGRVATNSARLVLDLVMTKADLRV
ncbi:DNA-binding transcriptional regulator, LysR family [Polaromonas sp. OV174]|nr:DNA-binding transcriptional regulator, LysR family [Polaromonas sp. OV174]